MIVLWIACGLLAIGFVSILTRLLLLKRDIKQLNNKLVKITLSDTNAHLTTSTFDRDIVAFVETINTMLERNRKNYFEKVRTEAELKRAITNISHDLRTPLTSALGYLQMLEATEYDEETKARYFKIVQERLDILTTLLNSLFEFARVMEGDGVLDLEKVNACNAICDVLSASYADFDIKNFEVTVDIPDTPVFYYCDAKALHRIYQNLVENAHIHGIEHLQIYFKDNSTVITNKVCRPSEIDTARLFDRFYTSDASRSNKRTGLGLAIVKGLTERMGGSISALVENDMLVIKVTFPG